MVMEYRNRNIRGKAWQLFTQHYVAILRVSFLMMLFMAAGWCVQFFLVPYWLRTMAGILVVPFLSPIVMAGYAWAMLRTWRGETPRARDLFAYLRPASLPFRIGALFFTIEGIGIAIVTPGNLILMTALMSVGPCSSVVLYGIMLSAVALVFLTSVYFLVYFTARLQLCSYILALFPEKRLQEIWQKSRSATKGGVRHIVGMAVTTAWPFFILMASLYPLHNMGVDTGVFAMIAAPLLGIFYGGYVALSMTGLATEMLKEERK